MTTGWAEVPTPRECSLLLKVQKVQGPLTTKESLHL